MHKLIKTILYIVFMLPLFAGCSDDLFLHSDDLNGERPIEFDFLLPDISGTRAFADGDNVKRKFESGDMIHVLGTFNTEFFEEGSDTKKTGKEKRYGALRYNGKKWEAVAGSMLTWPTIATSGQFEAYYISGSDGVLTGDDPSETYLLSDITPASDPLKAVSDANIGYGRAVRLNFHHICAHLTLIDLEPMVAMNYFFHTDYPLDPETKKELPFNNAFKISLGKSEDPETEGQPTLNFEFCQKPDESFDDFVYISADAIETETTDESGKAVVITKAGYFLEPGYYETFSLHYPATKPNTYNYLKYDYKKIPDNVRDTDVPNTPPNLEAGKSYNLTITKSSGVEMINPPTAGGWDESDVYFKVNVEEFLKAVNSKKDYFYEDVQILQATADGVKLLHNVDFHNFRYSDLTDNFRPNIDQGTVFDGNYHYIQNLASPLFRYNYGTIRNVGIKNIEINAVSYEKDNTNDDMSRHGALCMRNNINATISNVRIKDVNMNIAVKSLVRVEHPDGSETHNIGCVLGSNTGQVSGVALSGNFSLNVSGLDEDDFEKNVNASVLIGGIVGQNAATGKIYDVSSYEGTPSFTITNACIGPIGSYSVGGVVGESTGIITGVILSNMTIDGSKSKGVTSYMGGMAGQLTVSSDLTYTAAISSCIAGGKITAGTTTPFGDITSGSYIGGIAGANKGVPVTDCRTTVSVYGSLNASENGIYATGGAFGRIREASKIEDLIVYGAALVKPKPSGPAEMNYVGNFAGIIPKEQNWDTDYAEKNIIVRVFNGIENIGASLDSNNQ